MTVRIGILLERQMVVSSAVMWTIEMGLYLVSDLLNLRYILIGTHVGCLWLSGVF